ncbi:MAG TPA: SMC-Scp complex subunit ScpB [Kofleriaceae bacterium]
MSRKRKKANEAVPEEILAEGSGPHQDADSLAEAANQAFSGDDQLRFGAAVDHEEPSPEPRRATRTKRGLRTIVTSDEPVVAVDNDSVPDDDEAIALMDSASDSVGPELEEAEVEAAQTAQADEQILEDAVMRAEAEAELGTAEPEAADCDLGGEEDLELGAALPTTAATMDDTQLKHLVEALIFAADKPVTLLRLRQLTRISDVKRLEAALATLAQDFADRGIALQQVSGGFQFRTNTHFSTWVQQLIAGRPVRLSRAQLETLAIVAYRQPITRPEVDEIRGVDSSATLRLLMDRSLIRILGKKEDVGRPLLYGTTREFLDFFSLGDLRELPTLREYSELSAESRKVMSDRLGIDGDGIEAGEDIDAGEAMEAMDSTVAPEPSLEELVRDFAQTDLDAHVGTDEEASDDASLAPELATDDDMSMAAVTHVGTDELTADAGDASMAGESESMAGESMAAVTHVGTDEQVTAGHESMAGESMATAGEGESASMAGESMTGESVATEGEGESESMATSGEDEKSASGEGESKSAEVSAPEALDSTEEPPTH